eukprot:TRINITY_DN39798_c0_g1_i1.p1 TRINITY_DN39798_c0_g1~~TRINITY_DN39798_c0_g1_i1.p1  ORF type:complete len:510 (+),score=86.86 TRINITY_DN39798_c0_g1_i1:33-1562(+)
MTAASDQPSKKPRLEEATSSAFPAAVSKQLCSYIDSMRDGSQAVVQLAAPEDIRSAFQEAGLSLSLLGEQACESQEFLHKAIEMVLKYSVRTGHPLFFNQLYARGDPVAIAADWVSAATNTNCHTYEVAPVYTLMEAEVLAKLADVVGGPFSNGHDGLFVPGGSISNLYGLHLAHHKADPDLATRGASGGPRCVAFTSDQCHYSYLKSARLIGIGSDNLISVGTDEQGRMRPDLLEAAIVKAKEDGGRPFFVGSTAGTTVIGAYDPFDKIGEICKRHGLWHHVDACWGGGALFCPGRKQHVAGIEQADSLAWNPHKMSGAPLQCSIFLTQHKGVLAKTNGTNAAYLFQPDKLNASLDTGDKTIQCGRKTDMFKLWLMWKAKGDAGMRFTIEHCFRLAEYMADKIRSDTDGAWQLVYEPSCTNVCFWYVPKSQRPFTWSTASKEQRDALHKVAPFIKSEMQKTGDALIGFQAVNGRPNFFRMVFASCDIVREEDISAMMERMADIGERMS